MPTYKVVRIGGGKTHPVVLDVPDQLDTADQAKIANWAMRVIWQETGEREWHQKHQYITERSVEDDPLLSKVFEAAEWDTLNPTWLKEPSSAMDALEYAKTTGQTHPEYEHLLVNDPKLAFSYSVETGKRFLEGEEIISKFPGVAVQYADYNRMRMKDAEDLIAKDDNQAFAYGEIMGDHSLWDTWTEDEIARHPVWIYMFFKESSGPVPEGLDSAMMMLSFSHPDNKWVKKYLKLKKQRSRKNKKSETLNP